MVPIYRAGDLIVTNDRHGSNRLIKALIDFTEDDLEAAGCLLETRYGVKVINLTKTIAKGFFVEELACKTLFVA